MVRDLFTEDFAKLVIEGDDAWDTVSAYVESVAPDLAERVQRFERGSTGGDIFATYRVDEQIQKGLDRKVWLPSGGSLIIDRTEAMTVVDVNTGKFTGSGGNLEETVTKNNLEAAEEIVRQLRLRDIGGIIVVDFIDMVLESNRDLVVRRLVECLGRDRTRHQVAEVTSLGLVQMTRKRIGTGLLESFSENCEHCHGRGVVIKDQPVDPDAKSDDGEGRRSGRRRGRRGANDDTTATATAAATGGGNDSSSDQHATLRRPRTSPPWHATSSRPTRLLPASRSRPTSLLRLGARSRRRRPLPRLLRRSRPRSLPRPLTRPRSRRLPKGLLRSLLRGSRRGREAARRHPDASPLREPSRRSAGRRRRAESTTVPGVLSGAAGTVPGSGAVEPGTADSEPGDAPVGRARTDQEEGLAQALSAAGRGRPDVVLPVVTRSRSLDPRCSTHHPCAPVTRRTRPSRRCRAQVEVPPVFRSLMRRVAVYAIVRAGSKQQKVAVGDVIEIDAMGAAGDTLTLPVVMVVDGEKVTATGLDKASVTVEVTGRTKGPKIIIQKYKNKTGYKKRQGHRQKYTQVKVTDISL